MPVTWTAKDRISSIVFTIKQVLEIKRLKRLWINSLEVDEVRKGFANLHDNRKDLLMYEEAKARQISDWLVGMNGSRLYSLLLQGARYSGSIFDRTCAIADGLPHLSTTKGN